MLAPNVLSRTGEHQHLDLVRRRLGPPDQSRRRRAMSAPGPRRADPSEKCSGPSAWLVAHPADDLAPPVPLYKALHDPSPLRHPGPRQARLRSDRSGAGDDVCLRTDGLQLRPHRQRPAGGGVRRAVPPAARPLWRRPRGLCGQRHRRRRQDQPEGRRRGRGDRRDHRPLSRRLPRRHGGAGRPAADVRAARDPDHGRHRRHDRPARRQQLGLRRRGPRPVQHPGLCRLRQAFRAGRWTT